MKATTTVEAASAKTASMATTTTTAAASGRHGRLNQANRRKYEQGYKRFPHHASSIGTISLPKIRHFLRRNYSAIKGR
jgi:hypothetical protein